MSKRIKRSAIWAHFEDLDLGIAQCNLCQSKVSYKSTVFNLKKHVKRRHPSVDLTQLEHRAGVTKGQIDVPSWTDFKAEVQKKYPRRHTTEDGNAPDLSEVCLPTREGPNSPEAPDSNEASQTPCLMTPIKEEMMSDDSHQGTTSKDPSIQRLTGSDPSWSNTGVPSILEVFSADYAISNSSSSPEQTAPQQPAANKSKAPSNKSKSSKKRTLPNVPPKNSPGNGGFHRLLDDLGNADQLQSLVEAQEASAVSLSLIAKEFKRKNDLEEERLQVEKRKASAFEAIAEFYRLKCRKLELQ